MYMRVSVRQSDLCVSAIGIADCVLSCMFLGFLVLFMVSSSEPAPPAAPCALHRCGFPVGTLMRLDGIGGIGGGTRPYGNSGVRCRGGSGGGGGCGGGGSVSGGGGRVEAASGGASATGVSGERSNLLVILGQFVSHFVSARISAYQRCIRNPDTSLLYQKKYVVSAMYQRCISDVSVNYVISS